MIDITEDDLERARALLKPYMERRLSGFELADAIALALAETRERAGVPLRRANAGLFERMTAIEKRLESVLSEAEIDRVTKGNRIAELKAENARLREALQEAHMFGPKESVVRDIIEKALASDATS